MRDEQPMRVRNRNVGLTIDPAGSGLSMFKLDFSRADMEIEDPGGRRAAMVKKALITPVRERWTVKVADGPDLDVQGNILDHEYSIGEGRDKVAEVSKKWFRVADTYGVQIAAGQNDVLVLAIAVAIDEMAHPDR